MMDNSIIPLQNGSPSIGDNGKDEPGSDGLHGGSDNSTGNYYPQNFYISQKQDYLRKGKWTAEEERYTNKVIEYFNSGILKLGEHERGITLRAYLAQKLGCDPMRITKKYTGASCLGKRVYHAYKAGGKNDETDKATADLLALETEFHSRLLHMSKRKGHAGGNYTGELLASSELLNGISKQTNHHTNSTFDEVSTPAIDSIFTQNGQKGGWSGPSNLLYGYALQQGYLHATPGLQQMQLQHQSSGSPLQPSARGYSSDATSDLDFSPERGDSREYSHQTDCSTTTSYRHRYNAHRKDSEGSTSTSGTGSSSSNPRGHMQCSDQSKQEQEITTTTFTANTIPTTIPAATTSRPHHTVPPPAPPPGAALHPQHPTSSSSSSSSSVPQHVKVSVHDSEVASSLLGFFTHLERNTSQEDMVTFFEGLQKNVAASTVRAAASPPKKD